MLCLVKVMKYFFLIVVLTLISLKSHSIQIMTECVSETGSSTFKIFFETKNNSGFLDYEFMNQEVRYLATLEPVFEGKIFGSAEFLSSTTGETKAYPFVFVLNLNDRTFTENIKYNCD